MRNILVCWIGHTDLRAPNERSTVGLGPIAQAVKYQEYDDLLFLSDYPERQTTPYLKWLEFYHRGRVTLRKVTLSSPTNFADIYTTTLSTLSEYLDGIGDDASMTFHLSPGTPAMAAVWIILAKTKYPATLIESSREGGVRTVSFPFDISADFIPEIVKGSDEKLAQLSEGLPPISPEFSNIIHRSSAMKRAIAKARRVAPRSIPVLIEGESGTGKDLMARAIHGSSPRSRQPFLALNCGAIPGELVESELFGHEKGAFTGADKSRKGYFEEANGGTLFLDEVGELPHYAQVKLLRTLQEGEIVRVGATRPLKVDVRIIAATNRSLMDEISSGAFREDLFYRLAVAVINLPPLRERAGDISLLIDHLMAQVNDESMSEPGYKRKNLSAGARNILIKHPWPGNVRELLNTLRRAAVWSPGSTITTEECEDALLQMPLTRSSSTVLNQPFDSTFSLPELISNVATHYLTRAMQETHGNKTKAAEKLGLPSYQTLTNWLKKYNLIT